MIDGQGRVWYNAPVVTPQNIAMYEQQFKAADIDGNGFLTKDEVRRIWPSHVKLAFAVFDTDNSKRLGWEEFTQFFGFLTLAQSDQRSFFTKCFFAFDKGQKGHLSPSEATKLMDAIGAFQPLRQSVENAVAANGKLLVSDLWAFMGI